ncbi:MAG: glutamine-hydrolyzing GMP synthase subunit GuaA [Candidatus Omnitrophica bacterium]|nr:glutamine-hydrolyzing GMP synthase subunit GuaA [Candidatus Omnitrophota bacterium]
MFKPEYFIKKQVKQIKSIVGKNKVIATVSGGLDSIVSTILAFKAIGNQLSAVYVDTGLMRGYELSEIKKFLNKKNISLIVINVRKNLFDKLKGISDPKKKRDIFRNIFYGVLLNIMKKRRVHYLVQGTIKTDFPEPISKIKCSNITTIEPLKNLSKNEVQLIGQILKIPSNFLKRPPFPGPGFAVRIIGEVNQEKVKIIRKATKIVEQETKNIRKFQFFPVLMEGKLIGTKKGKLVFGYGIILRAVKSKDGGKTAKIVQMSWDALNKIQKRLLKELPNVVHIFYSITDKPPATIELQPASFIASKEIKVD